MKFANMTKQPRFPTQVSPSTRMCLFFKTFVHHIRSHGILRPRYESGSLVENVVLENKNPAGFWHNCHLRELIWDAIFLRKVWKNSHICLFFFKDCVPIIGGLHLPKRHKVTGKKLKTIGISLLVPLSPHRVKKKNFSNFFWNLLLTSLSPVLLAKNVVSPPLKPLFR